jgi:hypothetical protein
MKGQGLWRFAVMIDPEQSMRRPIANPFSRKLSG